MIALSVDRAEHSTRLIDRLGITFALGADPQQTVVRSFGVQNPDTNALALHAVYIVDQAGTIIYRKVGRRRPVSAELIDAIDAWRGDYPRDDFKVGRPPRNVAYPVNNFQTLIEMAAADGLPTTVDAVALRAVLAIEGSSDDRIIAFRRFIANSADAPQDDLLTVAAWLARSLFIADKPAAIRTGQALRDRLRRVAALETRLASARDEAERDTVLHELAAARGVLTKVRADVRRNASAWNLRYAQGALRGFREVALEAAK